MTNEQVMTLYQEMSDYYEGNLPNPEHEPLRFAYYVRMFKYYRGDSETS